MEPEILFLAYLAESRERVERALNGRPGCCVEEEGCLAAVFAFLYAAFEFRRDHAAAVVDGDGDDVLGAEAEEVGGFFDGVVAVG